MMPSQLPISAPATITSVTQNSRSTSKPWPRASRPPAIAGARNSPAPIHDTPIQMIGDWMCTSRRKLNGRMSCSAMP